MCGKPMQAMVQRGYGYHWITTRCGATSPDGSPWLCDACEERHAGRDWRREAIEAGEQWDDDY